MRTLTASRDPCFCLYSFPFIAHPPDFYFSLALSLLCSRSYHYYCSWTPARSTARTRNNRERHSPSPIVHQLLDYTLSSTSTPLYCVYIHPSTHLLLYRILPRRAPLRIQITHARETPSLPCSLLAPHPMPALTRRSMIDSPSSVAFDTPPPPQQQLKTRRVPATPLSSSPTATPISHARPLCPAKIIGEHDERDQPSDHY